MDSDARREYKNAWARAKRAKDPEAARAADKIRRSREREQRAVYRAAWRDANPDYWKQYAENNREKRRAAHRKWREAHPKDALEATRRWRAANPEALLAQLQRRRARRIGASGTATLTQIKARFDFYGGRCWMCGEAATCMDHVKALCNGGSNWPANLRPACASCNARKGALEMPKKIKGDSP